MASHQLMYLKLTYPERKADIASMSGPIETVSIQISNKSKSDSDDGFASFRIYSGVGLTPSKSSSRTNARWINEGEKLVIKGRQISKGFFLFWQQHEYIDWIIWN